MGYAWICRAVSVTSLVAASLVAQVPAHAVRWNPTAGLMALRLARSGDTVHGMGSTTAPNLNFIHYTRSTDGGRTWPQREVPLAYAAGLGDLVADGDRVHVAVNAAWTGPHVVSSFDGGASWLPPIRISQASNAWSTEPPLLHVDGATINVFWFETRTAGTIWANRSTDGGLTWQPNDRQIDLGLPPGSSGTAPLLVAQGGELHVFWGRVLPTAVVAHQRSLDGGASWLPGPQLLGSSSLLRAAGDAGLLVVADSIGQPLLRSVDQGATWTPIVGHGITNLQDLAVHGSTVLLVGRAGAGIATPVQLQVSQDRGATWLPVPYLVPTSRTFTATARVTADALFVHFGFRSDQYSPPGVVIQSDDFGVTWRQVQGDAGLGLWTSDHGCVVLGKTGWNGLDVQAWVLEGHTRLGAGSLGTAGLVPKLSGTGLAGLGRTFSLEVAEARGGSVGAWFTSFGAATNVPIGSARLYLQQPIVTAGFTTSGAPGVAGVGTASLPVAVPAIAALAGCRLLCQAFVIDPAVADGFAATQAIETWIR